MNLSLNTPVKTPDHGDGIVFGRNPDNGKIVVRVNKQVVVPPEQKVKTRNGWQYEYSEDVLTLADGKRGK